MTKIIKKLILLNEPEDEEENEESEVEDDDPFGWSSYGTPCGYQDD